jgi:hypothetical protein
VRKNNNIIEINGKRYDAHTGDVLPPHSPAAAKAKPPAKVVAVHTASKPAPHQVARTVTPQHIARHPAPSHTLMRQAVHKPTPGTKRHIKAYGHIDPLMAQPAQPIEPKKSASRLDEQRLKHAAQVSKSRLVRRFSEGLTLAAPAALADQTLARPVSLAPASRPATAARQPRTTADLLERAIQHATSHEQPAPKLPRHRTKRTIGISGSVGLAILVLGLIVSQNLSGVRLQLASAKAGFSTSLPGYRPAGYSLGQLDYASGLVSAQFQSNSDDRHYTITQKRSPWDSEGLRNNFVANNTSQYQTVSAGGRTIYLYGQNDATWVNGGVWYTVQSDGSLNDRQLTDLATSL